MNKVADLLPFPATARRETPTDIQIRVPLESVERAREALEGLSLVVELGLAVLGKAPEYGDETTLRALLRVLEGTRRPPHG